VGSVNNKNEKRERALQPPPAQGHSVVAAVATATAAVTMVKTLPTFAVMQPASQAVSSGSAVASASTRSAVEEEEEDDDEDDEEEELEEGEGEEQRCENEEKEKNWSVLVKRVKREASSVDEASVVGKMEGVVGGGGDEGDNDTQNEKNNSKGLARARVKRMKPNEVARAEESFQRSKMNVQRLEKMIDGVTDKKMLRQIKNRLAAEKSRMVQRERARRLSKTNATRADRIVELEIENSSLKRELEYLAQLQQYAAQRATKPTHS